MTDRELMQQALDALEAMQSYAAAENKGLRICDEAIEALRARLAQPEPEPIAYLCENAVGHKYFRWKKPPSTYKPIALYTEHASPQRIWQGLTKEEARELCVANVPYVVDMVAALEARLKEKNT